MLRYISLNSKNSHTEVIKNHTKVTVVQNIKKKTKETNKRLLWSQFSRSYGFIISQHLHFFINPYHLFIDCTFSISKFLLPDL